MTLAHAAQLAAVGEVARALYYWVTNVIPSWSASAGLQTLLLIDLAVLHPIAWIVYFLTRTQRAAVVAVAITLLELASSTYMESRTLSLLSLDSIAFAFGTVLPALCWIAYLLGRKKPLWYLLLFCLVETALAVYQMTSMTSMIASFWREEPWRLLAAPIIWIVYWSTQAIFVRAAQRA